MKFSASTGLMTPVRSTSSRLPGRSAGGGLVIPPVLMQLMRHESIETSMRYYVGGACRQRRTWFGRSTRGRRSRRRRKVRRYVTLYVTPAILPNMGRKSQKTQAQENQDDRTSFCKRPLPGSNRGWRICNPLPYPTFPREKARNRRKL